MRLLIYGLIALVPLPLASVRPTWQWFWIVYVSLLTLACFIKLVGKKNERWSRLVTISVVLVATFIFWGLAQATIQFVPSNPFELSGLDELNVLVGGLWTMSSVTTLSNVSGFAAHLLFFCSVFLWCSHKRMAVQFVLVCGTVVAVYALYGFIVYAGGNETILWFAKWGYVDSLTGTFVNRNAFAAFLGLGLQCLIAYMVYCVQSANVENAKDTQLFSLLVELLLIKRWWLSLSIILTIVALMLTNSRAGFISAVVATLLLVIFSRNVIVKSGYMRRWGISIGPLLMLFTGLYFLSGEVLHNRLIEGTAFDQRFYAYPLILNAILDRPMLGFGLGTFENVFRLYRDETITTYFNRGHNDYLELAMTAGVPASVVLVIALFVLVFFLISQLKAENKYRPFLALGITISIQLGLHSLVDFPMQIPAVSYLWCALLAMSVAIAERRKKNAMIGFKVQRLPAHFLFGLLVVPCIFLLIIGVPRFLAELMLTPGTAIYEDTFSRSKLTEDEISIVESSRRKALEFADLPKGYVQLGAILMERAKRASSEAEKEDLARQSIEATTKGLALSPLNTFAWSRLSAANVIVGEPHYQEALKAWNMSVATARFEPLLLEQRIHIGIILYSLMSEKERSVLKDQVLLAYTQNRGKLRTYARQYQLIEWMLFLGPDTVESRRFYYE